MRSNHYRWAAYGAALVFLGSVFLAGYDILQTGEIRRALAGRQARGQVLARMVHESEELEQLAAAWAVPVEISAQIRLELTAAFPQILFGAPRVVGAQHLRNAEIAIAPGALEGVLEKLATIEGFPLRVLRLELATTEDGSAAGVIVIGWLETI